MSSHADIHEGLLKSPVIWGNFFKWMVMVECMVGTLRLKSLLNGVRVALSTPAAGTNNLSQ